MNPIVGYLSKAVTTRGWTETATQQLFSLHEDGNVTCVCEIPFANHVELAWNKSHVLATSDGKCYMYDFKKWTELPACKGKPLFNDKFYMVDCESFVYMLKDNAWIPVKQIDEFKLATTSNVTSDESTMYIFGNRKGLELNLATWEAKEVESGRDSQTSHVFNYRGGITMLTVEYFPGDYFHHFSKYSDGKWTEVKENFDEFVNILCVLPYKDMLYFVNNLYNSGCEIYRMEKDGLHLLNKLK